MPVLTWFRSVVVTAGIGLLSLPVPVRAQQDLSVDDVLARVGTNMRAILATLPEFVCTETVTSRMWDKGQLKEEHHIESTLMFVRDPKALTGMRELREIVAIDGKPAGPKPKLPKLPVRVSDEFATTLLFSRFVAAPRGTTYRLAGTEELAGRPTVRIEFATPPPRSGSLRVVSTVGGSMLIDEETMRLVQIEHHSADRKHVVSGAFQSVQIGEGTYWLPRMVTREALGPFLLDAVIKSKRTSTHSAEFSGCRKFEVSARVLPRD